MDKEFTFETPEEKEEYEQALAEFIDSDEFLEHEVVQKLKSISERDKSLVLNPVKAVKMAKAEKLLREIDKAEHLYADFEIAIDQLLHMTGAVCIYLDAFSTSPKKKTLDKFREALDLSDGVLIMSHKDGRVSIELSFHELMLEA